MDRKTGANCKCSEGRWINGHRDKKYVSSYRKKVTGGTVVGGYKGK